jgi:lipopolysaccharide transport system permease protein
MHELILEPGRIEKNYWRDLWRYRELFYFLAWRDILVRYKEMAIGVAWAVLRPFLAMVIFTFIFGKIAKLPAPDHVPYALLVFAGMLPWQFFATAMTEASASLITNANLISKVYFPRLVVPASSVITSFVDFLITLVLMALMMLWYQFLPDWRLLTLPFFIALAFGASFGIGLWLCALTVQYRDFRYITPFIAQLGIFISPVPYSSDAVRHKIGETLFIFYSLNPLVGVIDGFRWALLRGETPVSGVAIMISVVITFLLCFSGISHFRKMEKTFADVI